MAAGCIAKTGRRIFVSDEDSHALRYFPTGDGMTKIVLADDNADMRDYMWRLLGAN